MNKISKRILKPTPIQKVDGKVQPQAIELEQAVLGALMIDNESLSDTIDSLRSEYFYKRKCALCTNPKSKSFEKQIDFQLWESR